MSNHPFHTILGRDVHIHSTTASASAAVPPGPAAPTMADLMARCRIGIPGPMLALFNFPHPRLFPSDDALVADIDAENLQAPPSASASAESDIFAEQQPPADLIEIADSFAPLTAEEQEDFLTLCPVARDLDWLGLQWLRTLYKYAETVFEDPEFPSFVARYRASITRCLVNMGTVTRSHKDGQLAPLYAGGGDEALMTTDVKRLLPTLLVITVRHWCGYVELVVPVLYKASKSYDKITDILNMLCELGPDLSEYRATLATPKPMANFDRPCFYVRAPVIPWERINQFHTTRDWNTLKETIRMYGGVTFDAPGRDGQHLKKPVNSKVSAAMDEFDAPWHNCVSVPFPKDIPMPVAYTVEHFINSAFGMNQNLGLNVDTVDSWVQSYIKFLATDLRRLLLTMDIMVKEREAIKFPSAVDATSWHYLFKHGLGVDLPISPLNLRKIIKGKIHRTVGRGLDITRLQQALEPWEEEDELVRGCFPRCADAMDQLDIKTFAPYAHHNPEREMDELIQFMKDVASRAPQGE